MNQKKDTVIQFSGLKPGRYTFDFELSDDFFADYQNDEIASAKVHYDIILDKKEHTLLFEIAFSGTLTTACDRCLAPLAVPVEGHEALCVKFADIEAPEAAEDSLTLPQSATEVDLAQWLYEYAAVQLPMQHMHPAAECDPVVTSLLAAAAVHPAAPATDPRWEALLKLKEENKNN